MTYIHTFESFLQEGKDWRSFKAEEIAKNFMRDNEKDAEAEEFNSWLYMFSQEKRIEDAIPFDIAKEVIDLLSKKGYSSIDIEEVRTEY